MFFTTTGLATAAIGVGTASRASLRAGISRSSLGPVQLSAVSDLPP